MKKFRSTWKAILKLYRPKQWVYLDDWIVYTQVK